MDLLKYYIAAGFDPARFWKITPRLYQIEMDGARLRIQREREHVWFGAMLPHLKKTVPLEQFIGHQPDRSELRRRWVETWDKIDRALARNRA